MAEKIKKQFFCSSCDSPYAKWQGQCQSCKQWNTIIEKNVFSRKDKHALPVHDALSNTEHLPIRLENVDVAATPRINTNDQEFNRVLGGGLVSGAVVLLSGEPGVGKSTLLLQLFLNSNKKILYVSGEESLGQIKLRSERIKKEITNHQGWFLSETRTDILLQTFVDIQPELIIIDSIQTLSSPLIEATSGSISQIRQCTSELIKYAKDYNIPIILVGHITKEGSIAGPKILEHIVDTVLHFEGERHLAYRILRTIKNRFGSTDELGLYAMMHNGLKEINNPSEILISKKEEPYAGSTIASTIEGNRPLMIEIQALVTQASYGTSQRSTIGIDTKRLHMLIAVLEKRMKIQLLKYDIFLNLTGGVKVVDPAIDLAASVAIFSSYNDKVISPLYCFSAEVGLAGELRPVIKISQRINEAQRLGFQRIYISKYEEIKNIPSPKITIKPMPTLLDVLKDIFAPNK